MKVDTGWLVFCAAIGLAGYLAWSLIEVGVPVLMVSSTDPTIVGPQSPADRPSGFSEVLESSGPFGSEAVLPSGEAEASPKRTAVNPSRTPLSIGGSAAAYGDLRDPGDPSEPEGAALASHSMLRGLNAPGPAGGVVVDLELIESVFDSYHSVHGRLPMGTHEEILEALTGRAPGPGGRVAFVDPADPHLGSDGRLLDRWGSPYFFHQISSDTMEIRSPGPDRKLWTEDDVSSLAPPVPSSPSAQSSAADSRE